MKKFDMAEYRVELKEELELFLRMCSEQDRKFIDVPRKKRKSEDYARLMMIANVFGFYKILLLLAAQDEDPATRLWLFWNKTRRTAQLPKSGWTILSRQYRMPF